MQAPITTDAYSTDAAFAAACLDPEAPVPANVRAASPERARRRFAIYRNNVVVSLMEALAATFPATERVVGEAFFKEASRQFVRAHPPRGPILWQYGDAFPRFLESFAPAEELAYLPDLARLELAALSAFHAADAPALSPDALARLSPEDAMGLRVALHPALRLVRSDHPIATIWRMNRDVEPLGPILPWAGEEALVARPEHHVRIRALPPGGAAFLERIGARPGPDGPTPAGVSLGDAVGAALPVPGADIARILGVVLAAGALMSSSHPAFSKDPS